MTDTVPVLNQLNIVANNFDATIAFYRRLGVQVPDAVNVPEGTRHASVTFPNGFVLEFDNHALARTYNAGWRHPAGSSRALIGFTLPTREAVDQRYHELVAARDMRAVSLPMMLFGEPGMRLWPIRMVTMLDS